MDYKEYVKAHFAEALDDLRALAVIPAPSHHEERRAEWVADWFRRHGADPVIDEALNVIITFGTPTAENPCDVYIAHTDVVFPDTTPLPFVEDGDIFRCPGIGDDTANLACLLLAARYLLETGAKPIRPVLIAANSCEEGLGNLKGVRAICDNYPIHQLISFDGSLHRAVITGVGSNRYRVTVKTEGGHSFGNFGNRNAIAYLASMIDTLYRMKVPPYGKTTYNVGTIGGGTSVNTIAQEAWMLYEFRSDDRRGLAEMENFFEKTLDAYRAMGIEVECELLGQRPCNGDVDQSALDALVAMADARLLPITGKQIELRPGSTDCNIPLSRGIPAACLGVVVKGGGTHTREEWVDTASLIQGAEYCLAVVLTSFEENA